MLTDTPILEALLALRTALRRAGCDLQAPTLLLDDRDHSIMQDALERELKQPLYAYQTRDFKIVGIKVERALR